MSNPTITPTDRAVLILKALNAAIDWSLPKYDKSIAAVAAEIRSDRAEMGKFSGIAKLQEMSGGQAPVRLRGLLNHIAAPADFDYAPVRSGKAGCRFACPICDCDDTRIRSADGKNDSFLFSTFERGSFSVRTDGVWGPQANDRQSRGDCSVSVPMFCGECGANWLLDIDQHEDEPVNLQVLLSDDDYPRLLSDTEVAGLTGESEGGEL